MDKARIMKEERNNWTKLYYNMLKELEAIIDIQRWVKNMIKMAIEVNTTVIEMEEIILAASINNQMTNTTNITGISEDL